MNHNLLYDVPQSQMELQHMVAQAKAVADQFGAAPAHFVIDQPSIDARLTTAHVDLGVLGARPLQRRAINAILEEVMIHAATLDYDISKDDVFKALYNVASVMHSVDYVPMRVLGSTGEAMVPPKKKNV